MSPVSLMIISGIASAVVTFVALALMLRSRLGSRLLDRPNHRSMHLTPTPRIGGLAIVAGVASASLVFWPSLQFELQIALGASVLLVLISVIDDLRGVGILPRLAVHLACAAALLTGKDIPAAWAIITILAVVWSANLFNFMDGLDSLAGGMAAIGFAVFAIVLFAAGHLGAAIVAISLAAAAIAFLFFNSPPARVFMGDAGSIPIGFLAAAFGLYGIVHDVWSLAFPLTIFLAFWFDATWTLICRLYKGQKPWQAHREHFYQRMAGAGLSHRAVAGRYHLLMAICSAAALACHAIDATWGWLCLMLLTGIAAALAIVFERRQRAKMSV
jgi:UDP-GlcNAc:undecaprenyl-phosphate GlcNAc-1-phosphate transferase